MKKIIGKLIWDFSEDSYIPLGRFAPIVFGWMVDRKPVKKGIDNRQKQYKQL